MSKKANPKAIGAFVLGAIALIIAGIMIFGGGNLFQEKKTWVSFFSGSIKGLSVGAPVTFRGVNVGTVTDIQLRIEGKDLTSRIAVFYEIDPSRLTFIGISEAERQEFDAKRLIEKGLRAQLTVQSFVTGLLNVDLDFRPQSPIKLVGTIKDIPEIPTVPSNLEDFLTRFEKVPVEDLLRKVTDILTSIGEVIESEDFKGSIAALHRTLEGTDNLVKKVDGQVSPFMGESRETVKELRKTLQNLNKQMDVLANRTDGTLKTIDNLAKNMDQHMGPLATSLKETSDASHRTMEQATRTLKVFTNLAGDNSPLLYNFQEALEDLSSASRSVRMLAEYLGQHPEALIKGKSK